MDLYSILLSINKIGVLFFFLTLFFVGYEFYIYKKDRGSSPKRVLSIPEFNQAINGTSDFWKNKPLLIGISIVIVSLLIFGILLLMSLGR